MTAACFGQRRRRSDYFSTKPPAVPEMITSRGARAGGWTSGLRDRDGASLGNDHVLVRGCAGRAISHESSRRYDGIYAGVVAAERGNETRRGATALNEAAKMLLG